jgi:hypothetical protein
MAMAIAMATATARARMTKEGCLFMCWQCAALWQGGHLASTPMDKSHEVLDETSNNPLVTRLATAGVGHVILCSKFYVHCLPKSFGFKLRIRLKS